MIDVLVVVDMQNDFVTGPLGTAEARKIVGKVAEKIAGFDGLIAVTMDTHGDDYPNTQEGRRLPVGHCVRDTTGWQLVPAVQDAIDAKAAAGVPAQVFCKGAFGSVDLARWLEKVDREQGISSITFIGVCTDICVISNAILAKSALPEVPITVDAACCAGVTPESHQNALAAMACCQISVEGQ